MVVASKSEPKCKLCRHPQRQEIDQLLELRSNLTRGPDGKLMYTAEVVLEKLREWGVENPNEDNIKSHWKRHCLKVDPGAAEGTGTAIAAATDEMLDILDKSDGTVDGYLRAMIGLSEQAIRAKILRGEAPGVTVDHALKAVAELTKRSHNEAQHELLTALTGGIAQALAKPVEPKQLGPSDFEIIDAEVVEA